VDDLLFLMQILSKLIQIRVIDESSNNLDINIHLFGYITTLQD